MNCEICKEPMKDGQIAVVYLDNGSHTSCCIFYKSQYGDENNKWYHMKCILEDHLFLRLNQLQLQKYEGIRLPGCMNPEHGTPNGDLCDCEDGFNKLEWDEVCEKIFRDIFLCSPNSMENDFYRHLRMFIVFGVRIQKDEEDSVRSCSNKIHKYFEWEFNKGTHIPRRLKSREEGDKNE